MAVRCLIVDDNRSFLRAARTLLEREGLTIRVATTSAEVRTTSSSASRSSAGIASSRARGTPSSGTPHERRGPRSKLEPFGALIGGRAVELTHPAVEGTVISGWTTYEWLEGGRFLIQRAANEHPDFPDSLPVIGVMEGDNDLSMQYFDSRGVHRVYAVAFDGRELMLARDEPGFAQRLSVTLSDDGSTFSGVWQLNQGDQGYRDDLAFTFRRASGNA